VLKELIKTVKRVTLGRSQHWQAFQGIFLLRNTIILTQEHNMDLSQILRGDGGEPLSGGDYAARE
jgi:hypothetical protein